MIQQGAGGRLTIVTNRMDRAGVLRSVPSFHCATGDRRGEEEMLKARSL